jgi:A/G-specific adenine glycosylase
VRIADTSPEALHALSLDGFQKHILTWYAEHERDLPWRGQRDPYRILLSEVMAQQTQIERVIAKYLQFLERFPDLQTLASASAGDVVRAWAGLGYNRRALNLKRTAELVTRNDDGRLPSAVDGLEALPGIGPYTARAVACFAFNEQVAVVDTNVRKVLSAHKGRSLSLKEAAIEAQAALPFGQAARWNQALMDYGAAVLRTRRSARRGNVEPFQASNRFWRGRIVDALRKTDHIRVGALVEALPLSGREEPRIRRLVLALHEEGMVEYHAPEDSVRLPD